MLQAPIRIVCVVYAPARIAMASPQRPLQLLEAVVLLLVGCSGSSSHSLRYSFTSVLDSGQKEPQFYAVGYVDEQPFVSYDMATKKMVPVVPWMEEAGKHDPQYWLGESQNAQNREMVFQEDLGILQDRYNQSHNSPGLHTLQEMYGCVVGEDGDPEAGYRQFAYDGEDFLAFDKETRTWTAAVPQALPTKSQWEMQRFEAQRLKSYLEGVCVEWLLRYLRYGEETLQRTERPTVRVARKVDYDGQETLVCRAHGFYPKEIEVSWMKDGLQQQHTLTGGVSPNSDGTYHKWLSIEVDPKDRDHYRCHVEHDGLLEPLDLAWEEPASSVSLGLVVGVLVGVLLLTAALVGVAIYKKKCNCRPEGGYKATPGSDQGSDSSVQVPFAVA